MYTKKKLGLMGGLGVMQYDSTRKGFYDTVTGYHDTDMLFVGGRPNTGYYIPNGTYFDTVTGQQFGTTPPTGVSPISWYAGAGGQIVVPVGPGAVAQTQAEAQAMQTKVATDLAAQAQSQTTNTVQNQGNTTTIMSLATGTDWLSNPWVLGGGALAVYFLFFRKGRR